MYTYVDVYILYIIYIGSKNPTVGHPTRHPAEITQACRRFRYSSWRLLQITKKHSRTHQQWLSMLCVYIVYTGYIYIYIYILCSLYHMLYIVLLILYYIILYHIILYYILSYHNIYIYIYYVLIQFKISNPNRSCVLVHLWVRPLWPSWPHSDAGP